MPTIFRTSDSNLENVSSATRDVMINPLVPLILPLLVCAYTVSWFLSPLQTAYRAVGFSTGLNYLQKTGAPRLPVGSLETLAAWIFKVTESHWRTAHFDCWFSSLGNYFGKSTSTSISHVFVSLAGQTYRTRHFQDLNTQSFPGETGKCILAPILREMAPPKQLQRYHISPSYPSTAFLLRLPSYGSQEEWRHYWTYLLINLSQYVFLMAMCQEIEKEPWGE